MKKLSTNARNVWTQKMVQRNSISRVDKQRCI